MAEKDSIKNVIAVCNEFVDSKILYIDKKVDQILTAIAESDEVYALIADCLTNFNKEKEFEKIFTKTSTGGYVFNLPKEEVKIIAFTFCLLADISTGKLNFDDIVSKYFVSEEGKKDYHLFMQKVIIPFRDLLCEAFGVSNNITTVEAIETMKESDEDFDEDDDFEDEEEVEPELGTPKFKFKEEVNLEKTFELSKNVAQEIYDILDTERRQTEEVKDGKDILNGIVIACNKQDFEMLYTLVIGLRYTLRPVKNARFMTRELVDIVRSRLY